MTRIAVSRADDPTMRDVVYAPPAPSDVLLVAGNGKLLTIEIDSHDMVIGRGRDCDLVIDHPALSRRHVVLRPGPPAVVRDLGSTNGTHVAGELRRGGGPIAPGAGGFYIG